ncbi:MAG: Spy/CpxP family protein refolding chaperone [Chlamydiae bacterium]|nr:Spy/CpxP family protein refolding chaperone [Chlamydiota bacterium]MBI3277025.1 Spy/CpxP family protein refolding chaperone [Chlamydiota bacterium]
MKKKMLYGFLVGTILIAGMGVSRLNANVRPFEKLMALEESGPVFLRLMMDISDLNITTDQKVAIRAILKKHWPEAKLLLKELNASRIELREVIKNSPNDEKQITHVVYKRADVAAKLAVLRGKVTAEARAILTPEQEAKVQAIFERVDHRLEQAPDRVEQFLNRE